MITASHSPTRPVLPIDADAEQAAAARVVGLIALLLAMAMALLGVRMAALNANPANDQPALDVRLPDIEPPAAVEREPAAPRL